MNEHIIFKVTTDAERTAAYKNGVNMGNGRFWFTRTDCNQFVTEVQQAEEQQKEGTNDSQSV